MAVAAAAQAKKHVLVEKPMGLSATEARRMIAACDAAGVRLFVSYYRRFWPHVQQMREWIRAGRIGQPVQGVVTLASPPRGQERGWRLVGHRLAAEPGSAARDGTPDLRDLVGGEHPAEDAGRRYCRKRYLGFDA